MSVRQGRGPAQRVLPLSSAAEKAQRDERLLFRLYTGWRRSQIDDLLAGPLGDETRALRTYLRRLGPDAPDPLTGRDLVVHVAAADWLRGADDVSHATLRRMIGEALRWARTKRGLAPFDDPLWDQPESAGQKIHALLRDRVGGPP